MTPYEQRRPMLPVTPLLILPTGARLVLVVCLATAAGCAKDQIDGTAARGQRRSTFSDGIAWWDADDRSAWIAFTSNATIDREKFRKDKFNYLIFETRSPYVVLQLKFKRGSEVAALSSLQCYNVQLGNFEDSPAPKERLIEGHGVGPLLGDHDWATEKGIVEVSGSLKSGGRISGRIKGDGQFKYDELKDIKREWDLRFDVKMD